MAQFPLLHIGIRAWSRSRKGSSSLSLAHPRRRWTLSLAHAHGHSRQEGSRHGNSTQDKRLIFFLVCFLQGDDGACLAWKVRGNQQVAAARTAVGNRLGYLRAEHGHGPEPMSQGPQAKAQEPRALSRPMKQPRTVLIPGVAKAGTAKSKSYREKRCCKEKSKGKKSLRFCKQVKHNQRVKQRKR